MLDLQAVHATRLQNGHLFTGERAAAYQGSLWQMPSCPKMQTCGSISSSESLESRLILLDSSSLFPHVRFSDSSNNSMSSSTQHSFKSWWDHPHRTLQFARFDVCSDNGMLEIRQLWSSNSVLIKRPLSFTQTILFLMWQHCFKLVLSVCCKNNRGTKCVTLCDYVPEKNESNIRSYAFCQVANL